MTSDDQLAERTRTALQQAAERIERSPELWHATTRRRRRRELRRTAGTALALVCLLALAIVLPSTIATRRQPSLRPAATTLPATVAVCAAASPLPPLRGGEGQRRLEAVLRSTSGNLSLRKVAPGQRPDRRPSHPSFGCFWVTSAPPDVVRRLTAQGFRELPPVAGAPVLTDDTRLAWLVDGFAFWSEPPPRQPDLEAMVRATQAAGRR